MLRSHGIGHVLVTSTALLMLSVCAHGEALPEDLAAQIAPTSVELKGSGELAAPSENSTDPLRRQVLEAAYAHGLPMDFFKKLIWQESRFKPHAVSRAGAQGIAQFMPGTAEWRGLADPFNASEALQESARWLRELWLEFGNLGLAAAAYNAGPGRVSRWLSGRSSLPAETRDYVRIITGEPAERWAICAAESSTLCPAIALQTVPAAKPIEAAIVSRLEAPRAPLLKGVTISDIDAGAWGPWGLQLAGDWSQSRALAQFRKIQSRFAGVLGSRQPVILRGQMAGKGSATWYRVRIAEATRERAVSLCAKLEKAGGSCLVLRN